MKLSSRDGVFGTRPSGTVVWLPSKNASSVKLGTSPRLFNTPAQPGALLWRRNAGDAAAAAARPRVTRAAVIIVLGYLGLD
jgi:hypothetical protein